MEAPLLIEAVGLALHSLAANYPVAVEWPREAWPFGKPLFGAAVAGVGRLTLRRVVAWWERHRRWQEREQERRERWERRERKREGRRWREDQQHRQARRTRKRGARKKRKK
jgi:hypothetical protein